MSSDRLLTWRQKVGSIVCSFHDSSLWITLQIRRLFFDNPTQFTDITVKESSSIWDYNRDIYL